MEVVIEAQRDRKSGVVTHKVHGDGKIEERRFRAIYAGLSWPNASSPGYYVIAGELAVDEGPTRFDGIVPPRGKLQVLCERTVDSPFLNELAARLSDDCARLGCLSVYAEIELAEDQSFRDERACLFRELLQGQKSEVSLQRAPYTGASTGAARGEALQLSLSIVAQWLRGGELELPEDCLAREQLRAVTREDLDDPEVEPRLFAARALGHCVGTFNKLGGHSGVFTPTRRGRPKVTGRA